MKRHISLTLVLFVAVLIGLMSNQTHAAYPDKPIVWIVHYSPGGGFDMVSRAIARELQKSLGVPVVVKNVTGAGGRTGATLLYRAKPDGYTVGLLDARALTISQLLYNPSYDMEKFGWIGVINSDHTFIFVPKNSPFKSMEELRKTTRPIRFTVTTAVTVPAAIYVPEALKFPASVIAGYGGASEAIPAIMRGDGDATTGWSYTAAQSFLRTGDIVPLLVNDRVPDPRLHNVPTLADFGIADVADGLVFYRALATPPGTPKAIRSTLAAAVQKALAAPETVAFFKKVGAPLNSQFGDREVQRTIANVVQVHKQHLTSLKKAIGQ